MPLRSFLSLSPQLLAYESYGTSCPLTETLTGPCYAGNVGLLLTVGFLVNGPYALITTAVSAELVRIKRKIHNELVEHNRIFWLL